ncbi:MAG: GtrA family protein [Rhodobacteraceae bacterium]|nr:GtrA family protein [Paracoccaceae bacterium]
MTSVQLHRLGEVLRFGAVGLVATVVHTGVALVVHAELGLTPQVANLCGYALAVWVSYIGHARFTFAVTRWQRAQFLRFVTVSLAALLTSSAVTALGTYMGWRFGISMACVAVVVPGATFFAAKFWAFSDKAG